MRKPAQKVLGQGDPLVMGVSVNMGVESAFQSFLEL
jgi:hypothetical protein